MAVSFVSIVDPWGVRAAGTCGAVRGVWWVGHLLSLGERQGGWLTNPRVALPLLFARLGLPDCWVLVCLAAMQLKKVKHVVELSKNDSLPLDYASQLCNSDILSRCTHFIAFAFHDSDVMYVGRWTADVAVVCRFASSLPRVLSAPGWRVLD